jgi:hypothetical protein
VAYATVDDADRRLAEYRWTLHNQGYAMRGRPGGGTIYMHREVLGLARGDGNEVDHENRRKLDNRRSNLRVVTHAENGDNCDSRHVRCNAAERVSRHRGVQWHGQKRRWRARYRGKHLGLFANEADAAAAAREARGE